MSIGTMFSALESSRLARTVSRAREEASFPLNPAGEGRISTFFRSAVLSVFPFRTEQPTGQNQPVPLDRQSRVAVSRYSPIGFFAKGCSVLTAALRPPTESRDRPAAVPA